MRISLPVRITLVLWVVLISTVWNTVRAVTSIAWSGLLAKYAREPGPVYIGLTGALFAIVGGVILWAFWHRSRWAPAALIGGSWIYVAWGWADRLAFQAQSRANWPFAAVATAAGLLWITAVALDRRNRAYFGKEANGRKLKDDTTA
ncbi:MAG: hypothetical protein ACK2T0_03745 [Anaerolineales bacterium]